MVHYLVNEVEKTSEKFYEILWVLSQGDYRRFANNIDMLLKVKIIVLHYGVTYYQFEIIIKK